MQKKQALLLATILIIFTAAALIVMNFLQTDRSGSRQYALEEETPSFQETYTLTNDKVSKNAAIAVHVPEGMDVETAKENITFEPQIAGQWEDKGEEKTLYFRPKKILDVGKVYTAMLKTDDGAIRKDFFVDEDPEITAIFPGFDTETHEDSEITIMFNRPMVPLTSLEVLEDQKLPVTITPETKGKFKWIGTKTLQFIPDETLIPSSNYMVEISEDFASLEGLNIEGTEHQFTTRPLRFESIGAGRTVYNQPIRIKFNQAIDLDRTSKEIEVYQMIDTEAGDDFAFVTEYGTKKTWNKETNKYNEEEDKSVLLVYAKEDNFGRKKLWNFKKHYQLWLKNAYPLEGDIELNDERYGTIEVTDVIASVSAESENSYMVRPDFFDPEGKLIVNFYEDINKDKSKISAPKMRNMEYGEKCIKENEDDWVDPETCEKETDKQQLIFSFKNEDLKRGEEITMDFQSLVNTDGLKINPDPIEQKIKAVPILQIMNTSPDKNETGASVSDFVLCTSTPLTPIALEDIDEHIKSSAEYEFKYWNHSRRIYPDQADKSACEADEFETTINLGLIPNQSYTIDFKIIDHFGQQEELSRSFTTGDVPEKSLHLTDYQKFYNVTTPKKTKFTYAAENMEYVNLHICRIEPQKLLELMQGGSGNIPAPASLPYCLDIKQSTVELEAKYWVKNFFQIDLYNYFENIKGHYLITLSHPDLTKYDGDPRYQRNLVTVTDLSLVEKKVELWNQEEADDKLRENQTKPLQNMYWVSKLSSLEPVPGAEVEVLKGKRYGESELESIAKITTNEQGIAKSKAFENVRGVIVRSQGDSAVISRDENMLEWGSNVYNAQKIYLYTDRPIYRPGHKVFAKGLCRIGHDGNYEVFREKKIPVKVYDSRNEEIWNGELDVNDFGSFNFELQLDKHAALGTYRIESKYNYAYFDVEEYTPAAFKVETTADKEEYISGDTVHLDVNASYYFGAPVEGGKVEYTIMAQDYYFDRYTDEYFSFGSPWYGCYFNCYFGDRFLKRNSMDLASDGTAKISEKMDLKQLFQDEEEKKSKIVVVNVTVTNTSGQSITKQQSLIVHNGEYYLGLKTDKSFLAKNGSFEAKVKSVDTEGNPLSVDNLDLTLYKVDWVRNKRREVDGGFYYRWEKQREEVKTQSINTDSKGNWSGSISVGDEGEYELEVTGKDDRGNEINSVYYLYVWGEEQTYVSIRPRNDTTLDIVVEKQELNIGDSADIIIKSPFKKAKALISIERGQIFEHEIVDVNQSLYKYSFPIKPEYTPNVYVSVVLLGDTPELKYGKKEFKIQSDQRELDITVTSNKEKYLPGEEISLDVEVKDHEGKPVETELSIAVVDMSVLALKGNPKKNPVVFFYGHFPLTVSTLSNVKNILYEIDLSKKSKGGDGGEADDLASKKRGIFKDTAYWNAVVKSDANGKAKVSFTLPDDLTTWQIESLGITKDTRLGVDYKEFMTRKELMLTPLKPRFVIPGDEFSIGAKVFNQTDSDQDLQVTFKSESLELIDEEGEKSLSIAANNTETMYFNVKANSSQLDDHVFELSAFNDNFNDTVENRISVTPNDTYEATATSAYSQENKVNEIIYLPGNIISDKGELTVNSSATLAVFLSDALNYFIHYPYGCAEQIASKLAAIATIQKGMNVKNVGDKMEIDNIEFDGKQYTLEEVVKLGLARIYQSQKPSGGFAYYPNLYENFYLTLHMAPVIHRLKEAGFEVNEEVIRKAVDYINKTLFEEEYLYEDKNTIILTAYVLTQLHEYGYLSDQLTAEIRKIRGDKLFLEEQISNLSLASLAMTLSINSHLFAEEYKNEIYATLENRIDIDSRGSYLASNDRQMWQYYETPIKNTAFLLKALVAEKKDNQILDKIVRWILRSRSKDGAWGSTNNTLEVVDAFTQYLEWRQETESSFDLSILLNEEEKESYAYRAENIFDQNTLEIAIADIPQGVFNTLSFEKENKNDKPNFFYYDMSLKYFLPVQNIPPRDEGFSISRHFYALDDAEFENPVKEAKVGDVLKGRIEIHVAEDRNFVSIEDFIPAGMELINFELATEDQSLLWDEEVSEDEFDDYYFEPLAENMLYPDFSENRDDRLFLFNERLYEGSYEYEYYVRVLVPGKFHHLPAIVSEMYFPENFGRTKGEYFYVNVE